MKIIKQKEFKGSKDLKQEILAGKIFIYPTDTIYGLGCDAPNKEAVEKIRAIKQRDRNKPLSIIAPNFGWIKQNCVINIDLKKYLPGPYTLLLKKKNPDFLKWASSNDRIGIRIPANNFTKKIQEAGVPFVTTSVNFSGEPFALKIEDIPDKIKNEVDYIIPTNKDEKLSGIPSILIMNCKEIKR